MTRLTKIRFTISKLILYYLSDTLYGNRCELILKHQEYSLPDALKWEGL
ncbi:hypothetical protein [Kordia sp.]|nr:hypothetical protein [Kordia sp.]MCH2195361.1 hypothetical protein [Kordia sp.]